MVFGGYSFLVANKHNLPFSQPPGTPKPISEFTLNELTPTPSISQTLSTPIVKPPFNSFVTNRSCLGAHFHMPNNKHILQPADLLGQECHGALELLRDPEASSAAWTYPPPPL